MNYYEPRQVNPESDSPDAGKWRYTCSNRRTGTYAVGYCAEGCPGHDDKEGAYAHQTAYLLDRKMRLDATMADQQRRCEWEGCGEWTQGVAEVEHRTWTLCDEHRTRENVAALFGSVGDSFGSW